MVVLSAAVAVLAAVCALQLLLTFGVIRRLREHTGTLSVLTAGAAVPGAGPASAEPPVGSVVAPFAATDVDGRPIGRDDLGAGTLVAFVGLDCAPCESLRPDLVAHAAAWPGGREQVLFVVAVPPQDAGRAAAGGPARSPRLETVLAEFAPVGRAVVERPSRVPLGPVAEAFGVTGVPTLCVLDAQGRITASGHVLAAVPRPLPA